MAYKSFADLIKPQEEEPIMSEMAPADYENMQSPVAPEMLYSTPKLADALPPKPEQPEVPMLAEADTQQTPPSETPMSKSEALIAEYNKLLGKSQEDLAEARRSDRMLKVGGSIGDALATYLNAQGQMNVKAPGVQVQQGAGLGKIADMFATAPEIQSDVAQRREAMMKQYGELAKGERAEKRLTSEAQTAKDRMAQQERLTQAEIDARLEAARIGSSKRNEGLDFKKEQAEYAKVVKLQESFNKDKQVTKAEERIQAAETLRSMVDGNPITQEAAKTFAARASGEVGALSDQDRAAYGGTKAILSRINQIATQAVDGELTKENKKFMKELADKFEQAGRRDLNVRLDVYAKQGTKRIKMSEDEVKEIIRPDLTMQQKEQQTSIEASKKRREVRQGDNIFDADTKEFIRKANP
jgi:hypothetical protein